MHNIKDIRQNLKNFKDRLMDRNFDFKIEKINNDSGVARTQCISCIPSTSIACINSLWLAMYLSHSVLDLKLKISVLVMLNLFFAFS